MGSQLRIDHNYEARVPARDAWRPTQRIWVSTYNIRTPFLRYASLEKLSDHLVSFQTFLFTCPSAHES